jgi:hypothetical protein
VTARQKIFWLRLATLIGLCLPALELAWRWYTGGLEPRPVTARLIAVLTCTAPKACAEGSAVGPTRKFCLTVTVPNCSAGVG